MYHQGLSEIAQLDEQEHMQKSLERAAARAARREAGVTWLHLARTRIFRARPAGRSVDGSRSLPSRPPAVPAAVRPRPVMRVIGAAELDCPAGADC